MTRRAGVAALVVVGLLLVAVAVGAPSGDGAGRPLDPDGTGPLGAAALRMLLEDLGADLDVRDGPPPPGADVALVLGDRLNDADRAGALAWVDQGGVLVVADPRSPLAGGAAGGPCPAALDGVEEVAVDVDDPGRTVARGAGDAACLGGLVQVQRRGAGVVVALGTPAPFTNQLLGDADGAVLAAALLAPSPGTRLAWLVGPSPTEGDPTLADLVPSRVRQALAQAVVAAGLWAAWRARRLGRPVDEAPAVAVAGSELVVAVGHLLAARSRPGEAAAVLRADVRGAVAARLGLGADAPVPVLAAAVAAATGLDPAGVAGALGDDAVTSDADLVAVADRLDRIRAATLGRTT